LEVVRAVQQNLIDSYEKDFSKHINASSIAKVGMIWNSIPAQLAKEKKQWIYKRMKQGARASQFEDALYWLEQTGLIYKVSRVGNPIVPLSSYQETAFKLYMIDIGLLSAKAGLSIQNLAEPSRELFSHFKGSLTEQYVLQELINMEENPQIFYWANDRKKGLAEVDFVIQMNGKVIPIEVKASINLHAKSLKAYIDYYKPDVAVRTSLARYGKSQTICDIPLYLIGQLSNIIK
jgi:predicted AAA+ superfamily ATPase